MSSQLVAAFSSAHAVTLTPGSVGLLDGSGIKRRGSAPATPHLFPGQPPTSLIPADSTNDGSKLVSNLRSCRCLPVNRIFPIMTANWNMCWRKCRDSSTGNRAQCVDPSSSCRCRNAVIITATGPFHADEWWHFARIRITIAVPHRVASIFPDLNG